MQKVSTIISIFSKTHSATIFYNVALNLRNMNRDFLCAIQTTYVDLFLGNCNYKFERRTIVISIFVCDSTAEKKSKIWQNRTAGGGAKRCKTGMHSTVSTSSSRHPFAPGKRRVACFVHNNEDRSFSVKYTPFRVW